MVISSTTVKEQYVGTGAQTSYSYPNPFYEESDLVVSLNGIEQTLTTHYTVTTGAVQDGHFTSGTVIFNTPPALDAEIWITRDTPAVQSLDFSTLNTFDPDAIETLLDRHALINQDTRQKGEDVITVGTADVVAAATPLTVSAATPLVEANIQPLVDEAEGYRDESLTNAGLTAADVISTNADVVSTNADVVSTNADVVTTNADVLLTNADVVAAELAKTGAETAETNAETAQTASETARDKAQDWAEEDEDVEVEAGQYSAKHHALKAEEQKDALTGTLTGDLLAWTDQVGSASPSKGARLRVDSTDDSTIITLASSPDGDTEYTIIEADGVNFTNNPYTLNPNGNNINGVAGNQIISARDLLKIVWKGATTGYQLYYGKQASSVYEDKTGDFTALNGGKYSVDESATVTIPKVVAGYAVELKPKSTEDFFAAPATLETTSTDTFFDSGTSYSFDDNGTILVSSSDGATINVELIGVEQRI